MYKSKLQELCQEKRWGLPKYACIKEGPDHHPHFTASVSVNSLSFHSHTLSSSSKLALNDAAMLPFLHFTSGSLSSSFESINGETGTEKMGQDSERKSSFGANEGGDNAAKVAYRALAERQLKRTTAFVRSGLSENDTVYSIQISDSLRSLSLEDNQPDGVSSVLSQRSRLQEIGVECAKTSTYDSAEDIKISTRTHKKPRVEEERGDDSSFVSSKPMLSSQVPDLSSLSISDSGIQKTTGTQSYLLFNKVRVYPCIPNFSLPKGLTLLPISDDKWVAYDARYYFKDDYVADILDENISWKLFSKKFSGAYKLDIHMFEDKLKSRNQGNVFTLLTM
ncbi:Double-stranded RNA-binding domain [Dillenia turbinata]|uniref:Double-stranded RNA-binding domain n=1 Tax=Dillenia turbinata TaxID=194707 RepID=A0AAN8VBV7_9MAGN